MNYEVYKLMDALQLAVQVEPENFWAQLKFAELHYRLRALIKAEQEIPSSSRWRASSCRRFAGSCGRAHRSPSGPNRSQSSYVVVVFMSAATTIIAPILIKVAYKSLLEGGETEFGDEVLRVG